MPTILLGKTGMIQPIEAPRFNAMDPDRWIYGCLVSARSSTIIVDAGSRGAKMVVE